MKVHEQIKDLILSSDLDCIKLGLVYLKQDLDKYDIQDKYANYLRNFYYHVNKRIRIHDIGYNNNWLKPRFYLTKQYLISYIHNTFIKCWLF